MTNVKFWNQDGFRTFDDFLREGLVEYLDVNEENNSLVRFLVFLILFESRSNRYYNNIEGCCCLLIALSYGRK